MSDELVALAAVHTGPGAVEVRRFAVPEPPPGGAILCVEACGICGTDVEVFDGHASSALQIGFPLIPGHEPVGVIARIDDVAAARWRVAVGDRVAVEPVLPCGACRACLDGDTILCTGSGPGRRPSYGYMSTDTPPGLWGGYAQYLVLQPGTRLHRAAAGVPATRLAFANALAAGVAWVEAASPAIGDTVVVLGPGPRGIACALTAKVLGAGHVIVTGLSRDGSRLEIARAFGADTTIDVERDDLRTTVAELTGGRGADVVIDTTPYATSVIDDAVDITRRGGTVVLAGLKGGRRAQLDVDLVAMKALRLLGVRSAGSSAWRRAVGLLSDESRPWSRLHTHTFGLHSIPDAIAVQAGRVESERPMHVLIDPWHPEPA